MALPEQVTMVGDSGSTFYRTTPSSAPVALALYNVIVLEAGKNFSLSTSKFIYHSL
jgi:hypothetical protein